MVFIFFFLFFLPSFLVAKTFSFFFSLERTSYRCYLPRWNPSLAVGAIAWSIKGCNLHKIMLLLLAVDKLEEEVRHAANNLMQITMASLGVLSCYFGVFRVSRTRWNELKWVSAQSGTRREKAGCVCSTMNEAISGEGGNQFETRIDGIDGKSDISYLPSFYFFHVLPFLY